MLEVLKGLFKEDKPFIEYLDGGVRFNYEVLKDKCPTEWEMQRKIAKNFFNKLT